MKKLVVVTTDSKKIIMLIVALTLISIIAMIIINNRPQESDNIYEHIGYYEYEGTTYYCYSDERWYECIESNGMWRLIQGIPIDNITKDYDKYFICAKYDTELVKSSDWRNSIAAYDLKKGDPEGYNQNR